jgi:hypothetical protein
MRASHDALTKETTAYLGICIPFANLVQNQQEGMLIATAESASDTLFCSSLQSTFCCPDSSACLEQPLLEDEVPVGDWPPVCMIHESFWEPWDCDSFTESLSAQLAGVPGDTPISSYSLFQNSPNPLTMGGKGVIQYGLPKPANVVLKVYDVRGREVTTLVDSGQSAGWHYVEVDPADFTSGIYFYRINMGGFVKQRRMTVLR